MAAVLAVVGAMAAVAQVSSAGTHGFTARERTPDPCASTPAGSGGRDRQSRHRRPLPFNATDPALDAVNAPPDPSAGSAAPGASGGGAPESPGEPSAPGGSDASGTAPADPCAPDPAPSGSQGAGGGLDILGDDCAESRLEPHEGLQEGPRCVSTAFGEVSAAENNPSLLITAAPQRVRAGQPFTLQVSTRNLVRDRFLAAAAGGYYLESSFLNGQGLQRGHFHTACRMLQSTQVAPDPAPVPVFFKATEDGGGGARPDQVTIEVTEGLPTPGVAQCAAWAGDGSHRIPMMQRANQTPAFDVVRIVVTS